VVQHRGKEASGNQIRAGTHEQLQETQRISPAGQPGMANKSGMRNGQEHEQVHSKQGRDMLP
jgi:hypothetical protein